jgi:hypothetical protein
MVAPDRVGDGRVSGRDLFGQLLAVSGERLQRAAAAAATVTKERRVGCSNVGGKRRVGSERGGAGGDQGGRARWEERRGAAILRQRARREKLRQGRGICRLQQQRRSVPVSGHAFASRRHGAATHALVSSLWLRCALMLDSRCCRRLQIVTFCYSANASSATWRFEALLMGRARAEGGRKLSGVGAAPRAGARAAISETKGRRSLRLGAAHASAAADLNVSRGRAARRDMREGSSRSLGREGSVSAQSL